MRDPQSLENCNTQENWEAYARERWEQNGGPEQTRLFAYYFLQHVKLAQQEGTLLDVGCAMGDALKEFHKHYPRIKLFGLDPTQYFIEKAINSFGDIATFIRGSFDDITDYFDIIYCSNTIEHFREHIEIAYKLLLHCHHLYIMVPYRETQPNGKPLSSPNSNWHVNTFFKHSFDPLLKTGIVKQMRHWIFYTPKAWGSGPSTLKMRLSDFLLQKSLCDPRRQIVFHIIRKM